MMSTSARPAQLSLAPTFYVSSYSGAEQTASSFMTLYTYLKLGETAKPFICLHGPKSPQRNSGGRSRVF